MAFHSERRGETLLLTIDRPEARNALDGEVLDGIAAGMSEADADPSIRSVVLTAVGDRAFCSGMDLAAFSRGDGGGPTRMAEFIQWQRFGISKPVIAAVNGPAVAGGFELVLACDLVIAADHAFFGLPEVKRGLLPAGGGFLLSRKVPPAIAAEICLLGGNIEIARAYQYGLVNRVVPADAVLEGALALASGIAANAPLPIAAVHRLVRDAPDQTLVEAWAALDAVRGPVFASDDAKEGARAFIEKRPARWQGR